MNTEHMNQLAEFLPEIKNIKNVELREQVFKLVPLLPDYFWTAPASSSGKYHPACDLGEGGIVRHSIMVERIALDLFDAEIFNFYTDLGVNADEDDISMDMLHDILVIATLFHDCFKQGDGTENKTVFNHPILAANFLRKNLSFSDPRCEDILYDAVARHMGKWTTSKYDPDTVLEKPVTQFEKLVHTADLIASKNYIGGLTDWGYILDARH